MKKFDFEDKEYAILDGRNVTFHDNEGNVIIFSGFPSEYDATQFIMMGDFCPDMHDNDFISITNPKYRIRSTICN